MGPVQFILISRLFRIVSVVSSCFQRWCKSTQFQVWYLGVAQHCSNAFSLTERFYRCISLECILLSSVRGMLYNYGKYSLLSCQVRVHHRHPMAQTLPALSENICKVYTFNYWRCPPKYVSMSALFGDGSFSKVLTVQIHDSNVADASRDVVDLNMKIVHRLREWEGRKLRLNWQRTVLVSNYFIFS